MTEKDKEDGVDAKIVKMIVFAIGEQEYCIPILSVREIRGFEKTTTLPFAPHYVCGAINLRGIILTVIDLAIYLNIQPQADNPRRVAIIVESKNGVVCGLLVDRVIDMADINMNDVQAVSEESSSLSGLVMVNDRMIGVLQLETVVGELVGDMVTE
ncbi:chemotaxis protein CheW [Acetobacter peroxydans]|jgi:purine-binding chemotaxis protein CheW|uniref:chemotaxis protein CheW n=1 Tax=Acetobacter peroxydans TaxID=104098 RepID=UPI0023541D28|nr:chemotaxis protein CheW [Acetobacter peroxydans]MCH4142995.1 chemotaxis protein CheW [Acetobacter peroxydans]MCI1411530.1 chemotaxis protein CheW [Acetobacter peroxydans]MCI1440221.1 chemotaxis protein CheW [Acetobacter peroxydans]MCI1566707.1 chemotaxis protein CheW [Acetobacter peroxydans]MCI1618983.1 chemotaxis protein CheW [Acetobacter peroxydans]